MGETLKTTPLHALHLALGARMVPFAGYEMPVQYAAGVLKEHLHTREKAGLFDVSHMGQATLTGAGIAAAVESLVPGDIAGLAPGRIRYTLLLNAEGGIIDDLMITCPETGGSDRLLLVVNAACKDKDYRAIAAGLRANASLTPHEDRALLALQGPRAAAVLAPLAPEAARLTFMSSAEMTVAGLPARVSRAGYTGEDGFEISCAAADAEGLARRLLDHADVLPVGLGARDSLRLEAGLCLYGHDIDDTTSPIEAGLAWTIPKRRRIEGGFPGATRIQRELADGPARRRVGIAPEGRAPAREGTIVRDGSGSEIGRITSGGFGPSVNAPVAMGYVAAAHATPGAALQLDVRGQPRPARVVALPFAPHRYHKG